MGFMRVRKKILKKRKKVKGDFEKKKQISDLIELLTKKMKKQAKEMDLIKFWNIEACIKAYISLSTSFEKLSNQENYTGFLHILKTISIINKEHADDIYESLTNILSSERIKRARLSHLTKVLEKMFSNTISLHDLQFIENKIFKPDKLTNESKILKELFNEIEKIDREYTLKEVVKSISKNL